MIGRRPPRSTEGMHIEFSKHGIALASGSGIGELMQDLGEALATGGESIRMLGGGQPAHIPEVDAVWRRRLEEIMLEPGKLEKVLGNYDPPRGNPEFLAALAAMLRERFSWDLTTDNLAVTAGGQTAFFLLFNLLAGEMPDGRNRKILLPLVPEYIGYANQGIGGDLFRACPPLIDLTGPHEFKYRVDFDRLKISDEIAAICVSRPTNPTGNVLTDSEISQLAKLASENDIPLIIDNAYGAPFPNIVFTEITPVWAQHIILTLSLSKLGLPGTRTGVVIAPPEIANAIASMSSIVGLANPNLGQAIATPLIESGEILKLSERLVKPFYASKAAFALNTVHAIFGEKFDYYVHRSEGALFLWLWFPNLPISSQELYHRLKSKGVLIISGHHFFFGLEDTSLRHQRECMRISFAMSEATVEAGIEAIGAEVQAAWKRL